LRYSLFHVSLLSLAQMQEGEMQGDETFKTEGAR
jgi:hypothetical protein